MRSRKAPARPARAGIAGAFSLTRGALPALGCDLGGTRIKLVRLGSAGIEAANELATPSAAPASELIQAITLQVSALLPAGRSLVPLGIAVPGFLDPGRKRILRLSNLPGLDGVALGREVERRIRRVRATLDTDSNAAAFAEAMSGMGRGIDRVLYVTMGTGLGAAFVREGKLVRVSRHTVGQIAHLPLGVRGKRCYCGATGCAETLLSAPGIVFRARKAGLAGVTSALQLFELATSRCSGRALARSLWRETGELLGALLQLLAALFSPEAVVVGGGVAAAGDLFLPAARARLARALTPRLHPRVSVASAGLGHVAGAIGAALLATGANNG